MTRKTFAELWNPDPVGKGDEIRKFNYVAMAATALPLVSQLNGINKKQLTAAGAFAAANFTQKVIADQKALSRVRAILRDDSKPAPADLQRMAERLFEKAGITDRKPVVRIVSPQPKTLDLVVTGALGNSLAYGVTLAGSDLHANKNEALIMVGKKAHDMLSREEMAAVLAHETARAWKGVPHKGFTAKLVETAIESAASGVNMSGMFNRKSLGKSIPSMAGGYGRTFSAAKVKRLDEERIARNAVGLFPHPNALKGALAKTEAALLAEMRNSPESVFSKFQKLGKIMTEVKTNDERAADIDKAYDEALDFYRRNGLKLDLQDVLGGKSPPVQFKPKKPGKNP
jgi:Zn-dependent protease with chaperone function